MARLNAIWKTDIREEKIVFIESVLYYSVFVPEL